MIDTALFLPFRRVARRLPRAGPVPEPRRARAPVFITDAVTPWRGETLLLSLLRDQARADADDQTS